MQRNARWIGFYSAILLMIAPAIAGDAPAKQDNNPSQAGKSSIYFYDVARSDMHGKGKLMIDVDKHTFVFNGQDFTPSARIELRARATASADPVVFALGQATPSGNLHIAGTWEAAAAPAEVVTGYEIINGMTLYNGGLFVVQLKCYYSFDEGVTWHETNDAIKDISLYQRGVVLDLQDLGVPPGDLVRIHAVVVGGKDRTGSEVFQYQPGGTECWSFCAGYDIYGTTFNPDLQYWAVWTPDICDESP